MNWADRWSRFQEALRDEPPDPAPGAIPSMSTPHERQAFRLLAREVFTGQGQIVELGTGLGGLAAAMAEGLEANPHAAGATIVAYDRFIVEPYIVDQYGGRGFDLPPIGASFLPIAKRLLARWNKRIILRAADLAETAWREGPIEILLVDAMKSHELCERIATAFYPALIPGAILVHQDFAHYATPSIPLHMYRLRGAVEPLASVPEGTVIFRLKRPLDGAEIAAAVDFSALSSNEITAAFDWARQCADPGQGVDLAAARLLARANVRDPAALEPELRRLPRLAEEVAPARWRGIKADVWESYLRRTFRPREGTFSLGELEQTLFALIEFAEPAELTQRDVFATFADLWLYRFVDALPQSKRIWYRARAIQAETAERATNVIVIDTPQSMDALPFFFARIDTDYHREAETSIAPTSDQADRHSGRLTFVVVNDDTTKPELAEPTAKLWHSAFPVLLRAHGVSERLKRTNSIHEAVPVASSSGGLIVLSATLLPSVYPDLSRFFAWAAQHLGSDSALRLYSPNPVLAWLYLDSNRLVADWKSEGADHVEMRFNRRASVASPFTSVPPAADRWNGFADALAERFLRGCADGDASAGTNVRLAWKCLGEHPGGWLTEAAAKEFIERHDNCAFALDTDATGTVTNIRGNWLKAGELLEVDLRCLLGQPLADFQGTLRQVGSSVIVNAEAAYYARSRLVTESGAHLDSESLLIWHYDDHQVQAGGTFWIGLRPVGQQPSF